MRITRDMLRPELRVYGWLMGLLFRPRDQRALCGLGRLSQRFRPKISRWVSAREEYILRSDGSAMRVLIVTPKEAAGPLPGMLWFHGGGYVMGTPELDGRYAVRLIQAAPCVVVMPAYTLSVDKPYPAAAEDGYTALLWMQEHADRLGVRANQLFVGGDSAGGGLACAVTLMARDRGTVRLAFQMPLYPMLDDRMETPSMENNNAPVWNLHKNRLAWRQYLGEAYGIRQAEKYAAPARETDYRGLPPAYSFVGTVEPFYDEVKRYFAALSAAGVPCRLEEYPGCFHAFDQLGPLCRVSRQATAAWMEAFRHAAAECFTDDTEEKKI